MMPALWLLLLQISFSFIALSVLAARLLPRLRCLPRPLALELLLWTHVPRAVPLGLLAPGQVVGVAPGVANAIAWGDFTCAVLALAGIVALQTGGERAMRWVWLFSLVSVGDIVSALVLGLGGGVYERPLGVSWFVLTLYVPLVCVSQALIGAFLVVPPRQGSAAEEGFPPGYLRPAGAMIHLHAARFDGAGCSLDGAHEITPSKEAEVRGRRRVLL
jgi:hypothetical protein